MSRRPCAPEFEDEAVRQVTEKPRGAAGRSSRAEARVRHHPHPPRPVILPTSLEVGLVPLPATANAGIVDDLEGEG